MHFSFEEIWASMGVVAITVIVTLLVMSIASVYVAIERTITFYKARSQSRALAEAIMGPLGKQDVAGALKLAKDEAFKFSYLGHMLQAGLAELTLRFDAHGRDAAHRAMERAAMRETLDLKKGTAILATVGSTAPFVGLVGTVFGIINAFAGMAESGSGGLASVSGGIAEALVTTAVGIAVAIIGVWLFNYFNNRAEHIVNDMSVSVQEFGDWIEKVLIEKDEASQPGSLAQKD
jgi:biopolymer transport protein TolQ